MKNRWLLHIAFWLAYVINDTALEYAWVRTSIEDATELQALWLSVWADLVLLPPKLFLSYFLIYVIIDRGLTRNKSISILVAWTIPAVVVSILMHRVIGYYYVTPEIYREAWGEQKLFEVKRMLSAFLDIGFAAALAVACKLLRTYWVGREREKGLVKEKLEAELKFLRNQTNPHFLFNTLNNIYALARKKSEHTADVVMKLSKLLRFMLYESKKERIPLHDEIRMLEDYLELEKIRYNERLSIEFTKNVDDPSQDIAPLLLLPFIENAFKHGASETRFDSFIKIDLRLDKGVLYFFIENTKEDTGEISVTENIGLSNVRRQLELMYNEHTLHIENKKDRFIVHLTVNLTNDATI
jgi:two-component system, LytTR family, sensor kinase